MNNLCQQSGGPEAAGLHPHECAQGLSAFTDNWWMGITLLQTAFVREHNRFVDGLKQKQPELTEEQLFQYGRLYIAALIAKIHTIEWTPQLLFNPVLEKGMEANWFGIIGSRSKAKDEAKKREADELRRAVGQLVSAFNRQAVAQNGPFRIKPLADLLNNNFLFAFLAAAPGITTINTNLFGSPFALPEEFTAVYRLHPLVPDVLEFRRASQDGRILAGTESDYEPRLARDLVLGEADKNLTKDNLASWWVTMGAQRTGTLQLNNYPRFMHALKIQQNRPDQPNRPGQQSIDLAALEIVRDRERGVPRHSEFRANIGLTPLKTFNDFIDRENAFQFFRSCGQSGETYDDFEKNLSVTTVAGMTAPEVKNGPRCDEGRREVLLKQLRERDTLIEVYGGDINAVDTLVGWMAENTRPYGYALAETQFQIFILNASRRLFSDRFFTDNFNDKTYTAYGMEQLRTRGMRDVLADNFTDVGLDKLLRISAGQWRIANAFDPWTRKREGFKLDWSYDADDLQGVFR